MSRSRTLTLIGVLAGLALAVATSVGNAIKHVADTGYVTCHLLVDNFMALATPEPGTPVAVPHIQAKAFKQRIEKRERPVLTNSWRMCPST